MFSTEAIENAEACRFCWMCRHICPVGNATGNEADTPRARGLVLSMVERGMPYDSVMANSMYNCALCDACSNDCATAYEPPIYIREARKVAVVEGTAPETVKKSIDNIDNTGNIYGETKSSDVLAKRIESLDPKAEVLLFLGQTVRFIDPEPGLSIMNLLEKAKVSFTVLTNEPASGSYMMDLMGITGDIENMAKAVDKAVSLSDAKTIVALNPHDAKIFSSYYQKWNLLKNIEIKTATSYIDSLIKTQRLKPKRIDITVSLHDPCILSRGLDESDSVRNILLSMGITIKEMLLNRKLSRCCGGAVLNSIHPEIAKKVALNREDDALRMGYSCVVTACPDCFYFLRKYGTGKVNYMDIFSLLIDNI